MSNNSYGSLGLPIARLNDCFGKSVEADTFFINLYITGPSFMMRI